MKAVRTIILLAVSVTFIVAVILHGRFPQDLQYHNMADQRTFLYIPNFFNATSNLFFLLVGGYGLYFVSQPFKKLQNTFIRSQERIFYFMFFLGTVLVTFGSGYYHLYPSNQTLIWDRLSIPIAFMSFFSALLAERINFKLGLYLLFPLILLGLVSVGYWDYTEMIGQGDLRFYLIVLYLPIMLMPFLLLIYEPAYTSQGYIWLAYIAYILSKYFEYEDRLTYQQLHQTLSGHTIKHLLIVLGCYFILVYLKKRRPIQ